MLPFLYYMCLVVVLINLISVITTIMSFHLKLRLVEGIFVLITIYYLTALNFLVRKLLLLWVCERL